jgi:hypothetical protein
MAQLIQHGRVRKSATGPLAVSFGTPFRDDTATVVLTAYYPGGNVTEIESIVSVTANGFQMSSRHLGYEVMWIAVGEV